MMINNTINTAGNMTRHAQRAFTLVEVMVALAIVALALPALLGQIGTQVNHTAYLRDKSLAQWVAQNRLEEIQLEYKLTEKLLQGSASGETEMADRVWHWQATSEATAVEGMWRQTITVGSEPDEVMATAVGFIAENIEPKTNAGGGGGS